MGDQSAVLVDDADCGTCHAGCSAVAPADLELTVGSLDRTLNTTHPCAWAAPPAPLPEKPQWFALV